MYRSEQHNEPQPPSQRSTKSCGLVRGFLDRELAPHAQEWEDARWFPDEVFAKLAAQGLLGLKYPAELGGQGGDYLHEAVLVEELSRIGSGGTAAGIGAHINIATPPIWKFGTDEQKQRYLVPAIKGEMIGALGDHRARRRLGRGGAAHEGHPRATAAGW